MARTSRFPGFYKITVAERRLLVSEATGADGAEIEQALGGGGLDITAVSRRRRRTSSSRTCSAPTPSRTGSASTFA